MGSFSYTSRATFIFLRGVSLTHPVQVSFLSGEFLLHVQCWLHFYLGSFSYTSRAGFNFISGVSLKHTMLDLHFCGEFLSQSQAGFFFFFLIWGVSVTHIVRALFLSREFLLNIPCSRDFHVGSFSYTSHDDFVFMWGFSLIHPMLALFLSGEYLLHIPCLLHFDLGSFSYTSRASFNLISGLSLTIPCWRHFYQGSFSYTSRASFIFMWGLSLTHPMLALFFCGEFLLHIPRWLHFFFFFFFFPNLGSFSYLSHAGFIFIRGVSLTHPVLVLFLFWEFLLHIPRCLHFLWSEFV